MKSDGIYHALWVGDSIPALAAGCLASFVRLGHRVQLYTYDDLAGVPKGVEVLDAATILGRERIFRHHRTGTLSVFSDHFAYTLLYKFGGTWIDCDMYCVRPVPGDEEILYGREAPDRLNKSLFRLPKGSDIAHDLLGVFEHRQSHLPWLLPSTRRRAWLRHHLLRKPYYQIIPVATTGPAAFTYFLEQRGLDRLAKDTDVFCSLSFDDALRITQADYDESCFLTDNSLAVHLWNDVQRFKTSPPQPGSLFARIEEEGRGGPPAIDIA
ncbi:MAG: hypothetical protein RIC87_11855 [Kiloniellales bacterium]